MIRRAYETPSRLLQRAKFTEAEAVDLMDKMARLYHLLRHLGDPHSISGASQPRDPSSASIAGDFSSFRR